MKGAAEQLAGGVVAQLGHLAGAVLNPLGAAEQIVAVAQVPAVEGALADEQAVRVALEVVELALFVFDLEQLAFVVVAEGDLVAVGVDARAQLVQPAPAELGDGAGGVDELRQVAVAVVGVARDLAEGVALALQEQTQQDNERAEKGRRSVVATRCVALH